jgi:hypothetical protein
MFSQPKFGQKIALMPALAGLGAVVVLVVALALGARSQASLSAIEEGYSPSLESSRTLEQTMASFQGSLQDAVAAGDTEAVAAADSPAGLFRAELVTLRTNPVVDDAEIDELMAAFHSYAELASATSRQMITGQGRGDLMSNLTRMTGSYSALGEALATRTERDRERIARSASEASAGTDQVARGIASVSKAAAGTAGGAWQLRGSPVELAEVAGALDVLVTDFKLE